MSYDPQISGSTTGSYEFGTDDEQPESYDEQLDNSSLDKPLDYISITRINTSLFKCKQNKYNDKCTQNEYKDDLKDARHIINKVIYGRKRKSSNKLNAPNAKNAKFDYEIICTRHKISMSDTNFQTPSTSSEQGSGTIGAESSPPTYPCSTELHKTLNASQEYKQKVKRLLFKPQLMRFLKEKGSDFKVNFYLVENKASTKFSKVFSEMVTEECKERLCREKEVTKSYLLLFYRNVKKKNRYTPEIYALTTGSARLIVEDFAEINFVKTIERRVLQFPFHEVKYNPVDGRTCRESKLARPGHEITFTTWDFLGILVKNRTRQVRKDSSLYSPEIDAFVTQTGTHINSKFQLSKNKFKIQRELNLSQLGLLLNHFSKIWFNKKTFLVDKGNNEEEDKGNNEEEDDPMFQMYDYVSSVTDEELRRDLNQKLYKTMQDSMNGADSKIYLLSKRKAWVKADDFRLQCLDSMLKSEPGPNKKTRYKTIKKWNDFPSLDEVMRTLKKKCAQNFKPEWLDHIILKFRNIKAPLKECIVSRFSAGGIGTYIFYHGEWIEMKAEYLYCIERDFVEILKNHSQSDLPLLLPWKHLSEKGEKFKTETMVPKWKSHYEKVCKGENFQELSKLMEDKTDRVDDFEQFQKMSLYKKAACLYKLLECRLEEDSYNSAHTLLNMILPDSSSTKIITCDKKLVNEIELCDLMIFDESATYLVHVKAEFSGKSIRAVCSQIRNAADYIYREITLGKSTGIIDQYWKELTKAAAKPTTHENEVKGVLENMTKKKFKEYFKEGRDIIFVLACRDTRENAEFIEFSDNPRLSKVPMAEEIQKQIKEKSSEIISTLTKENFLTEDGHLTNKFILEGKNTKVAFIEKIKQWECIKNKTLAKQVSKVLMSGLSKSKSTIAKMDIIRLLKDFERYNVDGRKLQLKLLSIKKDFP